MGIGRTGATPLCGTTRSQHAARSAMDSKVTKVTKVTKAAKASQVVKSKTGRAIDAVIQQGERSRSKHFALHWLRTDPLTSLTPLVSETEATPISLGNQKNSQIAFCAFVVSKRNAKHAARRNLIRRVWREALQLVEARAPAAGKPNTEPASDEVRLGTHPPALVNCVVRCVVRLTKPFDKQAFKSAASTPLAAQIASEAAALTATLSANLTATLTAALTADLATESPARLKTRTPSKPNTNEPTQTPGGLTNKA
jgi:ribonuclease P protein component